MTTITGRILLCALASTAQAQSPAPKPTLIPMFISDEPGRGPAFLVECTNATGGTQSSASEVWPLTQNAIRLDGVNLRDEGGRIGPGLTMPVQPGETWRGIIELWQMPVGVSRAVAFGAMVRAPFRLALTPGRHTIAVRCDGRWSDDVAFFLEK
jgi:hypothetical protein